MAKEWVKITIHCTDMDLVYNVEIKNKNKNEWWVVGKREFDIPTNAGRVEKVTGKPPEVFANYIDNLHLPTAPTDVGRDTGVVTILLNKKYCTVTGDKDKSDG